MQAIEPEMVALSQDPENFGPSKTVAMETQRRCININDEAAVDAFIQDMNDHGGIDSLGPNWENSADASASLLGDNLETIIDDPTALAMMVTLYDPDPDQYYLNKPQLPEFDGRKWRQKMAIRVHRTGVQLGIRLWVTHKQVVLNNRYKAADAISLVSEFTDTMYALHVQKPTEWTTAAWSEFGHWLLTESLEDHRGIRQATILSSLADVARDAGVITSKQAARLATAILEKPAEKVEQPSNVRGKVISMKAARKLLKNRQQRH